MRFIAQDWVLPPLSVGEMTLRLYGALNYSQNSADVSRGPWKKERRPPLRHQSIISGGNLRVFENLAQTLVAVDAW